MKSIKIYMLMLALSVGIVSTEIKSGTTKPSFFAQLSAFTQANRKMLYGAGAALGAYHLIYNIIDPFCTYLYYYSDGSVYLLEAPERYKQKPDSVVELQEMLQAAMQEDYALMTGALENAFIKGGLNAMSKTEVRNHSRVGAITLATAKKNKGKILISWASISDLSEDEIKQLNRLQYQYVQEFYHAIRPQRKTYEVSTLTTNAFGKKTGIYYYAPTMKQKRAVQQMHMQRAFACIEHMLTLLESKVPTVKQN